MVVQEMSEPEKRADNVGVKRERKHRLKQRFEVRRKLGQGTYGKVQLAINKETGQEVAIKTIKKSKIDSDQDLMRIRREIQIMSSIQHPHIIHIFEVFENKDKIVLVMQFATGGELYEYVSERKVLNDNEARRIFRQVATAVYYCHKNKVCHRDLKLENILLDEKGNAKIGDFGLSNVFDEKHFLNTFCGSPLYASPEIVRGTPYYGPEVDCWSLGVLLYTLVYGAMPFDGSNFKRLVKQISEANYFEPKQKSDASALIRKLLAVNPAKRATIIDICTDWWVNKGYEHSLLQVAEDLANLTPVRLDLLLALAPVSPSATANDAAIAGQEQTPKKKKSKQKRHEASDESIPCQSSTEISTEVSTDFLTCPEEEEEEQSVDNSSTIEFIPAAEAAALEEAYQNELSELNNKRQASASFDHSQSVTKIPSQVTKKKKPKKTQEDLSPLLSIENQSSGYGSESTILSAKEVKQKSDVSPESNNSLKSITEPKEEITPEKCETIVAETKPEDSRVENNEKLESSQSSVKDDSPKIVSNNETSDILKDKSTLEQKDVISDTTTRESSDITSPKKAQLERKASFSGRAIGKVSIPKFIESKGETDKKPVPSYGSLADVKKAFQKRTDSIDKSKERVVPTYSVGDVKRAFERRTSLPAPPAPLWKNAGDRRQSEAFRTSTLTETPKNEPVKSISAEKPPVPSSTDRKVEEEIKDENCASKSEINVGAEGSGKDANVSLKAVTKEEIVEQKPSVVESPKPETVTVVKQSVDNENINEKNLESQSSETLSSLVRTQTSEEPQKTVSETKLIVNKKNEFPPKPLPPLKPKITPLVTAAESLPKISESVPSTPEIPASKAAPITRSYKKVTFTKDGACITETGKIISEKGADGTVTRVEKKSKVTHYPTSGASEGVTRTETKEETISSVEGSFDDDFKSGSLSPPIFGKPSVRRSESASSSGSTDIFDDIFDTWTGDPLFGNFSGKMRSLLQARSPFSNFMRKSNKKPKRRQRTESCERGVGDSATGFTRVGPNLTDHESDTDNEIDSPFSTNVGLWKFLNSNSPSSKFLERHRSMMSKHFGPERDVFPEEFFSSSANRSLSRDRLGSVNSRVPQTPPASFRVVFGTPTTTRRVVTTKQESFESSDGGTEGNTTPRASASASSSSRSTVKPLERNWSRQNSEQKSFEAGDFMDDNSSRRRVEQWLDMNRQGIDIDENHPVSMYSTIRPRMFTRYGRTMSSRFGREADEANKDETASNISYNTTHEYPVGAESNSRPPIRSFETFDMPLRRTYSSSRPMVEMRLAFGGPSIAPIPVGSFISSSPAASSVSDTWESSVTLPESSSLLDQLRTHGYKNLVTQRLSGTKISEPKYNANENTPSGQYKRGKSVLSSSSKRMIVNGACIANGDCLDDTECMKTNRNDNCTSGKDSPVATSSSSATSSMTSAEMIKNLMDRRESSFEECFPATGASSEPVVLQMSEHRKTNLISNQSSNTLNRSVTNSANVDSTTKETVQERILRKSFYSRFNDDRPHHRASSKSRRRFSFVEGEDIDDLLSNFESAQYLRRSVKLPTSLPTTPSVTALSRKPPFLPISQTVNTSNDMFQRMKLKANRVFENMQNRQPIFNEHLSRTLNAEDFAAARRSFLMHRNSLIDGHFLEENNSRLNSEWPFDDENTFINSNQAFRTDHLSSAQKIRKEMEKLNRKANNE